MAIGTGNLEAGAPAIGIAIRLTIGIAMGIAIGIALGTGHRNW